MTYRKEINAVGSYSIIDETGYVLATVYKEGMANRICRLLNEEGCGQ